MKIVMQKMIFAVVVTLQLMSKVCELVDNPISSRVFSVTG